MRVSPRLKVSTSLFLSIGAIVACTRPEWMVKYQDADPYYSNSESIAVDGKGHAFMGGFVDARGGGLLQREGFVAKYNAQGARLWDYRFKSDSADSVTSPFRGGSGLVTGPDDCLYVLEIRFNSDTGQMLVVTTKFDSVGRLLWTQTHPTGFFWFLSLRGEIRSDGNLYVSGGAQDWFTLSPAGTLVWRYEPELSPPGEGLDPFRGLEPFEPRIQAASVATGYTSRNLANRIEMVDASGNVLDQFDAAQLGVTRIIRAYTNGNVTTVLGESGVALVAKRIIASDTGFSIDESASAPLPNGEVSFDPKTGGLCYAAVEAGVLRTGYLDSALAQRWEHVADVGNGVQWVEPGDVVAAAGRCHSQYMTYATTDARTMVIVEDMLTGEAKPAITVRDFFGPVLAVAGSALYLSGMTGPYDTEEGTAATLIKRTLK